MNLNKNNAYLITQIAQQDTNSINLGEYKTGSFSVIFLILILAGILSFLLIAIFSKNFYKRSSKKLSFVRTGLGGEKIIKDSGSWVFPSLHEIIPVNMNTLRLEINRKNEQALITKDLLRINVQADFYVRVKSENDSIKLAAQTLGEKTLNLEDLKNTLEGKIVSVLSIVTSEFEMHELHEQRAAFVDNLHNRLEEEIASNGLELETVSLTSFNQTNPQYFDPQNALDAKGLAKLTEEIENRRQERNHYEKKVEIEIHEENQNAELIMQTKILEIERQKLELQKQEEIYRLEQESELSKKRMDMNQERENRQQKLEEGNIESQKELEIKKIESEQEIFKAKNDKELYIKQVELDNEKVLELIRQEQIIEIANKSCEQSEAQAKLFISEANTVVEEEKVTTAKEQARIEREKKIALIKVEEESKTKVLLAQSEADALKLRAEAEKVKDELEAAGKRLLHEANNLLSQEQISLQIKMAIIEHLPEIIRQSVKPMEKIEGIRIYQVEGLSGSGNITSSINNNNSNEDANENGNLVDNMISGALRYRVQAPLVDSVMKEIGLSGDTLESLTKPVHKVD